MITTGHKKDSTWNPLTSTAGLKRQGNFNQANGSSMLMDLRSPVTNEG